VDDRSCRVVTAGPDAVFSYEQSARTTAACPGADHWLNIPQYASNDLVDVIAAKIRDGLPAGHHRVLVELGNELWNQGSPRLQWSGEMGQVCGYADRADELVYRGWAVFKRVQTVFADHGRASEVKFLMAWQQGGLSYYLGRATALGIGPDVDVVSTAPYFVPMSETALNAAYEAATDEECADIWKFDFEYNYNNVCASSLSGDGDARRSFEATNGRSVEFIHYEGGPDSFTPTPATAIANGYTRNADIHYNPNTYFALYDFPYICKRVGGADGIAYFSYVGLPFWNANQGYFSLWGMSQYNGQPPGRGDGSDGKADNRLCLATPGKTNSKPAWQNQDEHNVSVRLQSLLDYNAAYAAYTPPPPPTNVDVPKRVTKAPWRDRLRTFSSIFQWSRVYTTPPPPHVNEDVPHQHVPTVIRQRYGASQAIAMGTRPVSAAPPPPVPPAPVPTVGRRAMPRWRIF
jgi:hypothetical protein